MSSNNYNNDNPMAWMDPEGELTLDQLLTCHLLFYTFIIAGKNGPFKEPERDDLNDYTDKAYSLLKKVLTQASESQISRSLQSANESLSDLYIDVNAEQSDEAKYVKCVHIGCLKNIVIYVKEHFADVDFNEYFTDIFYDEEAIYSPMATDLLKDYITKMDVEDIDKDFDKPEYRESREIAYLLYMKNWKNTQKILLKLPWDKALIAHVLSLIMCNRCLKRELYMDYQKILVSAVSHCKEPKDLVSLKQKRALVSEVNQAFIALMNNVLECIEQGIDDRDKCEVKNEFFALATDCAIGFANELENMVVGMMFSEFDVKYDDIVAKDSIKNCAENLFNHAIAECSEIYGFEDDEEDDEDEDGWDDEEGDDDINQQMLEFLTDKWDQTDGLLSELAPERLLVFHVMALRLCYSYLGKQFSKYRYAVEKAVSVYHSKADRKQLKYAIDQANQKLINLKQKVFEWIDLASEEDDELVINYEMFCLSVDNTLLFVKESIDKKTALDLLVKIYMTAKGLNVLADILEFEEAIYEQTDEEHDKIYKEICGPDDDDEDLDEDDDEDWDDEDDDEDWDDEDEEPDSDKELEYHLQYLFSELCALDNQGLIFHTVSLEIMRRHLPESLNERYRDAVNEYLSAYLRGAKRNTLAEKQLDADNEYVNIISLVSNITENFQDYDVEGDLVDYMLIPVATENCLYSLSEGKKVELKKVKELSYNKKTGMYEGELINKLASKYIQMAQEYLDNLLGE